MLAGLAMPEGKCEGFLDMLVPGEGIELKSIQFSISEGISIAPLQLATTGDGVSQMRPRTGENSNHKPKTDQKIDSFDRLRILYEMIISGECSTPENGGEVRWSRDLRRGAKRCVKYT